MYDRGPVLRATAGIALYAGAFGATFGAVAVAAGLSLPQVLVLSMVMFTGASQFALVGVLAAGGSGFSAVATALLLGLRNTFYGVPVSRLVQPRGLARTWTAQLVIDETTAMAAAQRSPAAGRFAFWATGVALYVCWASGTVAGALVGSAVDPAALGLDAAAPAVFLALLWPQLRSGTRRAVGLLGAGVAALLVPVAPAGVPVLAAAVVAVAAGLLRDPSEPGFRSAPGAAR